MTTPLPARLTPDTRALTAAQFQGLAEVPPELEWFANILPQSGEGRPAAEGEHQ